MLKQGLELKQQQKLSPLQIQTIKLIELPIQELEQRIRKELEENPVLDEDSPKESEDGEAPREVSLSEYKEDDTIPSYRLRSDLYSSKDDRPQYSTFSVKESFTQSLQEQLGYRNLTEHQYAVASFIIGSLDDDGYLRRSIDSIVDDLSFRANVETDEEEVLSMLKIIQEFDPAGVGARDLRECLRACGKDTQELFQRVHEQAFPEDNDPHEHNGGRTQGRDGEDPEAESFSRRPDR